MESKGVNFRSAPILLYIPVLHRGYLEFFNRYPNSRELWLIGDDLAAEFSTLHREIRAISANQMRIVLDALGRFEVVEVLGHALAAGVISFTKLITASERVSQEVCRTYFPNTKVTMDQVFLRYDENSVKTLKPIDFDRTSEDQFDLEMMALAFNEAEKSSCWWRHVGSVLVKNGEVIAVNHNEHVPSEQMPYVLGDPRDFIEAGTLSHFASSLHSEKMVLIEGSMRKGVSTIGADIYVSVFPCPDCAKVIAYSGIRRCFFGSGHASLDGQSILKSQGVELIYVPVGPR